MQRFMTHFRSQATDLLQRWGVAWHYQSPAGTLIAQNDRDTWTLQTRWPSERRPRQGRSACLAARLRRPRLRS